MDELSIEKHKVNQDKSDLKPCPFCGGAIDVVIKKHISKNGGFDYTIRCKDQSCAGRLSKIWTNYYVAKYAWNRRVVRNDEGNDNRTT